jgi:anti-sigma factor RsiW
MSVSLFDRVSCATILPRIGPYLDGELREDDRQRVEAHVASCQRCSTEVRRVGALRGLLQQGLAVSLPAADANVFWDRVEQKIEAHRSSRWRGLQRIRELFWFYPRLRWIPAAVLGATVLVFAADRVMRPSVEPGGRLAAPDVSRGAVVESVEGGPSSSVFLFSTPDQQLNIIWVQERPRS